MPGSGCRSRRHRSSGGHPRVSTAIRRSDGLVARSRRSWTRAAGEVDAPDPEPAQLGGAHTGEGQVPNPRLVRVADVSHQALDVGHVGNVAGPEFTLGDPDLVAGRWVVLPGVRTDGAFQYQRGDGYSVPDLFRRQALRRFGGDELLDIEIVDVPHRPSLQIGQHVVLEKLPVPAPGRRPQLHASGPPCGRPIRKVPPPLDRVDIVASLDIGTRTRQEILRLRFGGERPGASAAVVVPVASLPVGPPEGCFRRRPPLSVT